LSLVERRSGTVSHKVLMWEFFGVGGV